MAEEHPSVERRFVDASVVLAGARDIIDERSYGAAPPSWCVARGWADFFAALPDDAVLAVERDGLVAHVEALRGAPDDLIALARDVARVTALRGHGSARSMAAEATVDPRRASPRKRAQVAAFATLVRALGSASRVVDVGSGHGHLTRHLARTLAVPAEGWERDPARVAVASSLTPDRGARFIAVDVRDMSAALGPSDLVVGLHACGELGDHAVRAAGAAGAAVAIVGCCLQKRGGDRAPLVVPAGVTREALTLGRTVLGLGNGRDGDEGVEADLATRTASRVNRSALRVAFGAAGLLVLPGEEMRGVNRRRATGAFEELAAHAFAVRGLAAPSAQAVAEAARVAAADYESARRWSIARTMLARLVEVWVALDRAALLAQSGYAAQVVVAFDARMSPRNVAVLGAALR